MSQTESIWAKVHLKYLEKFFGFFRNNFGDLVTLFPEQFKSFQFLEGEDFSAGNLVLLKYSLDGQSMTAKIRIRFVDDVKKYIIYENVDGDLVKSYKVFRVRLEAINGGLSKVGAGNFAKWTIEFEKVNENVPDPESHLELFVKMTKVVDAYFSNNRNYP